MSPCHCGRKPAERCIYLLLLTEEQSYGDTLGQLDIFRGDSKTVAPSNVHRDTFILIGLTSAAQHVLLPVKVRRQLPFRLR